MAKKQCVCACVRACMCVCVCQTCIQGSCPEGPHLPHQVKQEIQAPPRPAGGPFHRGRGVGSPAGCPTSSSLHPRRLAFTVPFCR